MAELIGLGDVLAAVMVGVPDLLSVYVNETLLWPLEIVNGLAGVKVTVPAELLDSVTLRAASVVIGLPNVSCRCTVIVLDATPALVVTGAVV